MISGHGVATTSTSANRVGLPEIHQASPAMTNETSVNGIATRSASRTNGAREDCASRTSSTIRWYWESEAVAPARTSTAAEPFTEPDSSSSPATFSTGSDSPVSDDSSTVAAGETSAPSTGTSSPGRTRSTSPTSTSTTATRVTDPSGPTRWVCSGTFASSADSSREARLRAKSSSASPPVSMRQTTSEAQCSPTTTVLTIAVIASRSMPYVPARRSAIMPLASHAAIASANAETTQREAVGAPLRCRTPPSTPVPSTTATSGYRMTNRANVPSMPSSCAASGRLSSQESHA